MHKAILAVFCLFFILATTNGYAHEYFKSPDYWELTRGDQKDYINLRVDNYCKSKKIKRDSLEYVCGITHSLQKIFKDKYWFKGEIGDTVILQMARNERESFQIAIIPLKENVLKRVELSINGLKHKKGKRIPANAIKIFNVEYVKTTRASYPTPHLGWWPDPLVPMNAVDIPASETRAFWVEVRTPKNIPAGRYNGTITITGTNIHPTKLSLIVDVWDFTLPEEQVVQTCTWLNTGRCAKKYGQERKLEMYRKYAWYFLDHKINPLGIGKHFFKKDNYSVVTENLRMAFKRGLSRFEIPRQKGDDLKNYCDHLRKCGWFDRAMVYGYKDEPHPRDYEAFRKDSAKIRKVEPNLKIFMAESPVPDLYGAVDVWWSSMPADNVNYIKDRLLAGNEVWWYRCGIPIRLEYYRPFYEYPSDVLIDRPSIDMRIFYTMIWKFGMTPATFFYNGISWPSGFEKWPAEPWQISSWPWNGDGYVVYPGEKGPLPSIRLKCIADGIEDFEYLYILQEAVRKVRWGKRADIKKARELLAIPSSLVVFTYHYNKDPNALFNFREHVADMIIKLKQKQK